MSGMTILLIAYVAVGVAVGIWDAHQAARRGDDESLALSFSVAVFWPLVVVLALIPDGRQR